MSTHASAYTLRDALLVSINKHRTVRHKVQLHAGFQSDVAHHIDGSPPPHNILTFNVQEATWCYRIDIVKILDRWSQTREPWYQFETFWFQRKQRPSNMNFKDILSHLEKRTEYPIAMQICINLFNVSICRLNKRYEITEHAKAIDASLAV
jgi:hypothetical protein